MTDRRRDPRHDASWPSSIVTDDAILVGRTVDVSEFGLCVVTAPTTALKAGHSYRIELVGSSGAAISTVAEVRQRAAHRPPNARPRAVRGRGRRPSPRRIFVAGLLVLRTARQRAGAHYPTL
jgi:PilZ domain